MLRQMTTSRRLTESEAALTSPIEEDMRSEHIRDGEDVTMKKMKNDDEFEVELAKHVRKAIGDVNDDTDYEQEEKSDRDSDSELSIFRGLDVDNFLDRD